MKRLNTLAVLSFASFVTVLLTSGSALAQTSQEITDEVVVEVVVIGTRGDARSPLDSAVPVDVISVDDIAAAHSFGGELGELLQALAPSFSFPRQSNSGLGDHVRAAHAVALQEAAVVAGGGHGAVLQRQHTPHAPRAGRRTSRRRTPRR